MVQWRRDPEKFARLKNIRDLKYIVDLLFSHRRKTIRNCLSASPDVETYSQWLIDHNVDLSTRAETLPVETFVQLANAKP